MTDTIDATLDKVLFGPDAMEVDPNNSPKAAELAELQADVAQDDDDEPRPSMFQKMTGSTFGFMGKVKEKSAEKAKTAKDMAKHAATDAKDMAKHAATDAKEKALKVRSVSSSDVRATVNAGWEKTKAGATTAREKAKLLSSGTNFSKVRESLIGGGVDTAAVPVVPSSSGSDDEHVATTSA